MKRPKSSEVIATFTLQQAEKLTGVSARQLQNWDKTGFFHPSFAEPNRRVANSRIYSFRDLASLRILNTLRNESKVPLQHLRRVKKKLIELGDDLWAKTTLFVLNKKVVLKNAETGKLEDAESQQLVFNIPLRVVSEGLEQDVRQLRQRNPHTIGEISAGQRNIVGAKPTIAGTRIPVSSIQAFIDEGYTDEQIIAEYPILDERDIAAVRSAANAA
ncbi:MAG: DUF433 domain-containing protein [Pseudomonadota bacterium]